MDTWGLTSTETIRLLGTGEVGARGWGGGGGYTNSSSARSDMQRPKPDRQPPPGKTMSQFKEVGTLPMRSNLCALLIAV